MYSSIATISISGQILILKLVTLFLNNNILLILKKITFEQPGTWGKINLLLEYLKVE